MLFSDRDLLDAVNAGRLGLDPFDPEMIQPASIDLRLDHQFRIFDNYQAICIDPHDPGDLTTLITVPPHTPFVLHPGEFVLASTLEVVTFDGTLAGRWEGKSSLGRLGLLTHSTAGFIDPGFTGRITLELANVARLPITLWPGMPVGQLCVFALSSPARRPYGSEGLGSRYQGQLGPEPSRGVMV